MNEFTATPKKGTIELGMCNPNPFFFSKPYISEQGDEFSLSDNIFRTFGATHALSVALSALARWFYYNNKKPTLYLYAPFYLDYTNIVKNSGWCYDTVIINKLTEIKVSEQSVVLINFPNNPTGRDITEWERNFINAFSKIGVVIYDMVYNGMMKPCKQLSITKGIAIDSVSKRFTWCGMRFGWLALAKSNPNKMNDYLKEQIVNIIRSTTVCPLPYKTYNVRLAKLREKKVAKWYIRQYNKMKEVLAKYDLLPEYETGFSPFFLLKGEDELFKFFEDKNVNVLRGDSFGVNEKYYRITTAVNDKTIKAFDKVLGEFYKK